MKNLFWNIGKAVFAVFVFLYLQTQVSVLAGVAVALTSSPDTLDDALSLVLNTHIVSLISLISGVLAFLTLWLVWWIQGRNLWHQTHLHCSRAGHVVLSALLGVGVCLLVTVALGLIPWPETWMDAYTEAAGEIADSWSVIGVLATVIVAPVVEELVFRGVAYTSLKEAMPRWAAALLVSAVFGVLHGTAVWFCYTFVLSFVMIFAYEKTKSLWGPIALHMAFNLIGQLPLLGEEPSFIAVVLIAAGGAALTAVSGIVLTVTQEE